MNIVKWSKRFVLMIIGNLFIGTGVGIYRSFMLGVDPFGCTNIGMSGFLGIRLGNWQIIWNIIILVTVIGVCKTKEFIGAGTLVNMCGIGYMVEGVYYVLRDVWKVKISPGIMMLAFIVGTFFVSLGVALYMSAEMGVAPYDSLAPILEKVSNGMIQFRTARIITDLISILIGVVFCIAGNGNLREIIGIGTVCNALLNGPLIQFWKTQFIEPVLYRNPVEKISGNAKSSERAWNQ